MGKPRGQNGREHMSQSVGSERVSNDLPIHAFLSRHSFSTRRSLARRLVSVGGSLIRTADQARGKVGVVKLGCAYGGGVAFLTRRSFSEGVGEDRKRLLNSSFLIPT